MSLFTKLSVRPSYGTKSSIVTWEVDSSLSEGDFYVYRSPDGAGGWELLNSESINDTSFVDTTLVPGNLVDVPHYRVLCKLDNVDYDSPIVGIYSALTRREYAVCSKIMKMEFLQLSRADGIPVLVYKPKQSGVLSNQVDKDTRQHTTVPFDDLSSSENSYDRIYKGGYYRPNMTLVRLVDTGPIIVMDKEDGLSTRDENMVQARFLGFPHITTGDLVVNPATDDRYGVTETVKAYKFKGIFPVAFDTKLQLLSRKDIRYLVPIPTSLPSIVARTL